MSGWSKWGVKHKLFSVMLLVLALNALILLFAGSTLFEWFYTRSKITELKNSAQEILDAYKDNSTDFFTRLSTIENKNIIISLIKLGEDGAVTPVYHSRMSRGGDSGTLEPGTGENPQPWERGFTFTISPEGVEQMRQRIALSEQGFDIQIDKDGKRGSKEDKHNGGFWMPDSINLTAQLDDQLYLFVQTPKGYIKSTADLAVKYTGMLSIIILSAGALVIYMLAGRLTKPLCRMQQVADRIAALDFSDTCSVNGNDEIAKLGGSINNMSHELQASIEKLIDANQVLQSDLERQQKTDRMRRAFVANVSHDFKTPLTLMMTYAEALRETTQNDEQQEHCDIIVEEGRRLSNMVGRLLEISKLENGIESLERMIFCLDEVIDPVLRAQKLVSDRKGVTVTREMEDSFIVDADYQKIGRVMNNLIENAVKYTPDGGHIVVRGTRHGRACRVAVENTCTPIPEEQMECLFDSFYRMDSARTTSDSYGLGLAVVKGVMQAHEQAYGVENIENGVRFWVELPLVDLDAEDAPEEQQDDEFAVQIAGSGI